MKRSRWLLIALAIPTMGSTSLAAQDAGVTDAEVTDQHDASLAAALGESDASAPAQALTQPTAEQPVTETASARSTRSRRDGFDRWLSRGRGHLRAGRYSLASFAYGRAVRARPSDPRGHGGLGFARLRLGEPGAALAAFDEALRLDPGNESYEAGREAALDRGGDGDDASDDRQARAILIFTISLVVGWAAGTAIGAGVKADLAGIIGSGALGLLVGATAGVIVYNWL